MKIGDTRLYKCISMPGNIIFYKWRGADPPINAAALCHYGQHVTTFFPKQNTWYPHRVDPNMYDKIE